MRRLVRLIPVLILLGVSWVIPALGIISPSIYSSPTLTQSIPDQYILHYKAGVSPESKLRVCREIGAELEDDIPELNSQAIKISSNATQKDISATILQNYPEIDSVEPDYLVQATEIPNNTPAKTQWGLAKIQTDQAWRITHGISSVKIAILDSGIDSAHIDLASKVVEKKNFSESDTAEDRYGHGTHVAGIAAATIDNLNGISGVACNASLMNVKVLGDDGAGSYSWIIEGIIWAADNGANVINLSMSGGTDSEVLQRAIDYAWDKGAIVIVAAGNNGISDPSYPAAYQNAMAVAATDSADALYFFSDYGDWIDVTAPGEAFSTLPDNKFGTLSGTSMAAPFVSGLAGLAFAVAQDLNKDGFLNDEIRTAIQNSCDTLSETGTGSGRINAYKAISSLTPLAISPDDKPDLSAAPATDITAHTAILSGSMASSVPVQVCFEYGPTAAYGRTTEPQTIASGKLNAALTGLAGNGTYHYRLKVIGAINLYSEDKVLVTGPFSSE